MVGYLKKIVRKLRAIQGTAGNAEHGLASTVTSDNQNKQAALVQDIRRGSNILGRHPLNVQIQTVSTCNAKCYFCPYPESWQKENPGIMAEDLYRKIIQELAAYKLGKFCPYFDEPLMDRNIFDRIDYALSRLDFNILELSTNASLLSSKKIDDIVRLFPPVRHEVRISFHGADKNSFEAIMGLDFDACLENTLALLEKAQDHGLNILIRGAGIPRIQEGEKPQWFTREQYLSFWDQQFRKHGFKKLPRVEYFSYHDRAGEISRNEINFSATIRPSLKDFYCVRIDQWAHFLYTGELILCCMDYHHKTVFGDITQKGLKQIYSSEEYFDMARKVTGIAPSPEDFICKRCVSPGG